MKEVEITLKVKDSLENCENLIIKQGYRKIRKSRIEDVYMTQNLSKLNVDNIKEILSTCVLVRYLNANGKEFKKITYKNKKYDGENVISEEKISVNCDNLENAQKLFELLGFEKLVEVKYDVVVYSNNIREFAFQEVEGLGLVVEYEATKNMDNCSMEEIKKEKENMIKEIVNTGINIQSYNDVKKAYDLVLAKIKKI